MTTEPGKATLLAIFNEVKATREAVEKRLDDHEARIRAVEHKRTLVAALAGSVSSVIVAVIWAMAAAFLIAGCAAHVDPRKESRDATDLVRAFGIWDTHMGQWQGTGWFIATDGKTSILATAGHVCATDALLDVYTLSDGRGAVPIYDNDNPPFDDICLLLVSGGSDPLVVGPAPEVGDWVAYTGYPDGVIGTYVGEISGIGEDGTLLASIPAYFGSSGSALVDERGRAVGLCSQGDMRFHHHSWWTGTASLARARDFAFDYLDRLDADPLSVITQTLADSFLADLPE